MKVDVGDTSGGLIEPGAPDSVLTHSGHDREEALSPQVGVIVLHWGSVEMTSRCLQSLALVSSPASKTVFLIDNAQSFNQVLAESAAPLEVKVFRPPRNLGFAGGCSIGITLAMQHGVDFILLLNNDAVVEPSFLDHLLKAARGSSNAGILCPQILFDEDPNKVWYGGGAFSFRSGIPLQARGRQRIMTDSSPCEVDWASGCAMLIDPAVIRAVGSFDPAFFAYCEDVDLSLRVRAAGFKIVFVPASIVRHAATGERLRLSQGIYYSTRNLLEVMRRHAAWYHWLSFTANFLARWVGFFCALAIVRRRPEFVAALVEGTLDFARGNLGERGVSHPAELPSNGPEP